MAHGSQQDTGSPCILSTAAKIATHRTTIDGPRDNIFRRRVEMRGEIVLPGESTSVREPQEAGSLGMARTAVRGDSSGSLKHAAE